MNKTFLSLTLAIGLVPSVQALPATAEDLGKTRSKNQAAISQDAQALIKSKLKAGLEQRQATDYQSAEETFQEALKMSVGAPVDLHAECIEALAGLYLVWGRLEESQSLYEKAVSLLEGSGKPLLLAIAYDNMSRVCQERKNLDGAEHFNKQALAILHTLPAIPHVDLAKALNQQGMIAADQKNFTAAETAYNKALNLLKQPEKNADPLMMPTVMDNLGSIYLKRGEFGKAEDIRKKAVSLFESGAGKSSPDTAKSLMNLAAVYTQQKKYEEGIPYIKRAVEIERAALGEHHPTTLRMMKSYTIVLKIAHHDEELKTFLQSLGNQPARSK